MSSQHNRRIFFLILTILFSVATTLVVFYALGYRFNLEKGVFVYAGSITVKSNPRDVIITLDKESIPSKKLNYLNNSYHIDGIRPGEYLIEISAPGFRPWSKKIAVHSGISTEFWNMLLVKEDYPKTNFFVNSEKRFFLSPKNNYIAYTQENGDEFSASILNLRSAESENVFVSKDFAFTNNDKENIEWSPQSHAVIIPAIEKSSGEKNFFVVDIGNKKTANLKEAAGLGDLDHARWDPLEKNMLFFLSGKNLYRMDINSPDKKKMVAEKISSFDFVSNSLFYFRLPNGIVYKTSLEGGTEPSQITTSPPGDLSDDRYKIIAYDDNRIVFINYSNGRLYVFNKGDKDTYFRNLSNDARGVQFSNDGKKIIFWDDWGIYVYFARDWNTQPVRAENGISEVARFSQEVRNVHWAEDYEHVIFTAGKKIKIAELDRRDYYNIMDISDLKSDEGAVVSNFPDNILYFADKAADDSSTFDLFSIDFPEKGGLLGL